MRTRLRSIVDEIEPVDETEGTHLAEVLAWLDSGAPIFRTAKPATPPEHLVSYCLLVDAERRSTLLVDHRDAGLWLPPGGHVDVDEDPADAARRELHEELGVRPGFLDAVGARPAFVTRTRTSGFSASHIDISLWYVFAGSQDDAIVADEREFHGVAWWPFAEVAHGPDTRFDPHLPRFIAKLEKLCSSPEADPSP